MTHPPGQPGGGGGSNGGTTGPGRTSPALVLGVRNADGLTSDIDRRIAEQLRAGRTPNQLDRNGHVIAATTPQESQMRTSPHDGLGTGGSGNPPTNPDAPSAAPYGGPPASADEQTPPPPRPR